MKKNMKLGLVVAAFVSLAALPAVAQDDQGAQGQNGQRFQQMKDKILQRLKDREACIDAAQNFKDLMGCKPHRQGGRGQDQQNDGADNGGGDDGGSDSSGN